MSLIVAPSPQQEQSEYAHAFGKQARVERIRGRSTRAVLGQWPTPENAELRVSLTLHHKCLTLYIQKFGYFSGDDGLRYGYLKDWCASYERLALSGALDSERVLAGRACLMGIISGADRSQLQELA